MSEAIQQKFQKLSRALGRLMRTEVNNSLTVTKSKTKPRSSEPQWTSAFIDARWFIDAEGFISKLRVVLPNGEHNGSLRVTRDMKTFLEKIWKARKDDSSAAWYGLIITVSFDGVVTTEINNDANCVVDPTWFRS
jgi:hypothetical protein